jgi:flavorubredoxin
MPCEKALRHAMRKIKEVNVGMIAPQHGSILNRKREIEFVSDALESLDCVGIDGIVRD